MSGLSEVLVEKDSFMITQHWPEQKIPNLPLVITFGIFSSKKTEKGFGTDFLLKNGFETIYVAQTPKSYYQGLTREEFCEYVFPVVNGKDVYTYGTSAGGYAAIYFGSAIGANVIALSPRLLIDPDLCSVFSAKSKTENASDFLHTPMQNLGAASDFNVGSVYLSFDPFDFGDNWYYENKINPVFPNCQVLKIENGQHNVAKTLLSSGCLKEFLMGVFKDKKIPNVDVDIEKDERYTSKKAAKLFSQSDYKGCAIFLEKTFTINPTLKATDLLRKMLMKGVFLIPPNKKLITRNIYRRLVKKYTALPSSSDALPSLFSILEFQERLLDFESALSAAEIGGIMFGNDQSLLKKIRQYKKILEYKDRLNNETKKEAVTGQ